MLSHLSAFNFFYIYLNSFFILWLHHILFIYSSISGYLACFHFLAVIKKNAAVNIRECDLFTHVFSFLLGRFQGVELLDHMETPDLTFPGTADDPYSPLFTPIHFSGVTDLCKKILNKS